MFVPRVFILNIFFHQDIDFFLSSKLESLSSIPVILLVKLALILTFFIYSFTAVRFPFPLSCLRLFSSFPSAICFHGFH